MVAINYARDVRIGDKPARAVALGSNFVWPTLPERLFLRGQSMVYDFVGQKYATRLPDNTIDYTSNVNDLGILTRASTGTYWGPSGTLLEAAVDEARIQHDPVTGEALGVLIEPSATNLNAFSDFSNSLTWPGWEGAPEPDVIHGAAATKFTGADGVNRRQSVGLASVEAGHRSTITFLVRSVAHNQPLPVIFTTSTGSGAGASSIAIDFDLKAVNYTLTPGSVTIGLISLTETWLSDDTVRIVATLENSPIRSFGALWVGSSAFSGDFSVGGIQHETGPVASSYIPTIDSPVTRAADNAEIDLSDVFNPDEGTLRITAQVPEGEVVASLGDLEIVSDDGEMKTHQMTYSGYTGVPTVSLGNGIHSKLEYFPEAQS